MKFKASTGLLFGWQRHTPSNVELPLLVYEDNDHLHCLRVDRARLMFEFDLEREGIMCSEVLPEQVSCWLRDHTDSFDSFANVNSTIDLSSNSAQFLASGKFEAKLYMDVNMLVFRFGNQAHLLLFRLTWVA